MAKDNRPKIRVTPEAHEKIRVMAQRGNRSMTRQVSEMLVVISQPEENFGQSKVGVMAKHADGTIEIRDVFLDPKTQIEDRQSGKGCEE
jgi:hypothetical protein